MDQPLPGTNRIIVFNMSPLSSLMVVKYEDDYFWYDRKYSEVEQGPFPTIMEALSDYKEVVLRVKKINKVFMPVIFVDFKGKRRMDR